MLTPKWAFFGEFKFNRATLIPSLEVLGTPLTTVRCRVKPVHPEFVRCSLRIWVRVAFVAAHDLEHIDMPVVLNLLNNTQPI